MRNTMMSILVDDEAPNRELLAEMLSTYCPETAIVAEAESADAAYELIRQHAPQLVFLDVKMPGKSGFDLLRMFSEISFDVIFISGYDEYAIQAFEFNAVDYILKPIDHGKLVKAVSRAEKRITEKTQLSDHLIHFVHSMDEKDHLVKRIRLHHQDKVHIVDVEQIASIHALEGYSEIHTTGNLRLISSKNLVQYEKLLSPFPHFLRVNKSTIINAMHIEKYSKGLDCFVTMKITGTEIEVSRRKKSGIIRMLDRL